MSPLLRLPAELRDMIWKLALGSVCDEVVNLFDDAHAATQPALTRFCRQIRQETLPIFYGNLMIYIAVSMHSSRSTRAVPSLVFGTYYNGFLNAIGETNRTLLKHAFILIFEEDPTVEQYWHTKTGQQMFEIDDVTTVPVTFDFVDAKKDKFSFHDRCIAATTIWVWRELQIRVKFLRSDSALGDSNLQA